MRHIKIGLRLCSLFLVLLTCSCSDRFREHRVGLITLQPVFAFTLKKPNRVTVTYPGLLGAMLGTDKPTPISAADRILFSMPPSHIDRASPPSLLTPWIGMKKSAFIKEASQAKFKQAVRQFACESVYPLGSVEGIEYADAKKPPLSILGDATGALSDKAGIPATGRPREVRIGLRMAPRIDNLKTENYSELMLSVSCGSEKP